jgi:hypothetical protein
LAVKQIGVDELVGGGYWLLSLVLQSNRGYDGGLDGKGRALFGPNLVAQNMGAHFGGEVLDYADGLSFVTCHGSGHMVPQFGPQAA